MSKISIVIIIVIAVSIGALFVTLMDSSTYAGFNEAFSNRGKEYHVVGEYVKDKPALYNPEVNANEFIFYVNDNLGEQRKVILKKSKPQDFEQSEQVVIIGHAALNNEYFVAENILLKCPSKYNNVPETI